MTALTTIVTVNPAVVFESGVHLLLTIVGYILGPGGREWDPMLSSGSLRLRIGNTSLLGERGE